MSIVLRNKQMLALVVLALFAILLLTSVLLYTVWHINVLHTLSASMGHPLPMGMWLGS